MKNHIRSYVSREGASYRNFLMIDASQLLFDVVLGVIILLGFIIPTVWANLNSGYQIVSTASLDFYISEHLPWLFNFIHSPAATRTTQMVLWLFIGSVVYIVIWFIGSFLTSIRNDAIADSYLHPNTYDKSNFWASVISKKVIFVCLCVFLLVFIYAAVSLLFQTALGSYEAIINFRPPQSLIYLAGSLASATIAVHLFFILFRLINRSWKVIYNDL